MKLIYINVFIIFFSSISYCQGLNNDYQYDSKDLNNIFSLQGIETFKIPIPNTSEVYNITWIQYKDGGIVDSFNLYTTLINQIDSINARNLLVKFQSEEKFIRFYFKQLGDSVKILIALPNISFNKNLLFDTKKFKSGSRSFDIITDNKKRRVLSIYNSDNDEMHCAMEDTDLELSKRMHELISFYITAL